MYAQESLTFLFDTLALGFIFIATIDLSREIITLYKQTFVARQKPTLLTNPQSQQLSQLPDPWLLPTAEAIAPVELAQVRPKPILLLAPALAVEEVKVSANRATSKEVLRDIDVDSLKLREARKLAKSLGIAQKINGKDQNLKFLKNQIELKLQQGRVLNPEITAQLKEELIAS